MQTAVEGDESGYDTTMVIVFPFRVCVSLDGSETSMSGAPVQTVVPGSNVAVVPETVSTPVQVIVSLASPAVGSGMIVCEVVSVIWFPLAVIVIGPGVAPTEPHSHVPTKALAPDADAPESTEITAQFTTHSPFWQQLGPRPPQLHMGAVGGRELKAIAESDACPPAASLLMALFGQMHSVQAFPRKIPVTQSESTVHDW